MQSGTNKLNIYLKIEIYALDSIIVYIYVPVFWVGNFNIGQLCLIGSYDVVSEYSYSGIQLYYRSFCP